MCKSEMSCKTEILKRVYFPQLTENFSLNKSNLSYLLLPHPEAATRGIL